MNTELLTTELLLPSRFGFEKVAMSAAAIIAEFMGFPSDRVDDLKTAVSEACLNAIEHGNQLNEKLCVSVTLFMGEQSLEVRIGDHGPGVHGEAHRPDMDRKLSGAERVRGMGMFLIRELVDEVEYVSEKAGSYARLLIRLDTRSI